MEHAWGRDDDGVVRGNDRGTAWGQRGAHMNSARGTMSRSVLAPGEAREFIRANLCREHAHRALGTVTLAASEFVTQAVLGGSGPLVVGLDCDQTTVTLSVRYRVSAAVSTHSLDLADDLSSRIIEGISRASGAEWVNDSERRLWCTIPTGYISLAPSPVRAAVASRKLPPRAR